MSGTSITKDDSTNAFGSRTTLFKRNRNTESLRQTAARVIGLRDAFDEMEDLVSKMDRKSKLTQEPLDKQEKKDIRRKVKMVIKTIAAISSSPSVKSSTDGVFKNELTRATGSIIDYLNSDEDTTAAEMIEKLEDLRDYIDDSIEQTEPEITGESPARISVRIARKTTLNRRQTMRQTIRQSNVSKGGSVVERRSILSKNVYDKKQVVEEFEKIRDVFEDIQTKITMKQQNNIAESEVNKAMKNALRVIQATGKISSVKQVDSVFRDSLANTAKSMVEVLVNDKDDEEKIFNMETHMTNVLDMIDNGSTDHPPIVKTTARKWKRFGKRPSEDNDIPLQAKTSKVLKNVSAAESSSSADPIIMEVKMAMDQILDFTKDYDYSDEKIKEFRKILKGSLTLVKSMARNEVVMDSVATDFRETLGKATEQMIFFISGEADNIEVLNSKIQNVRDILEEIQHPKTPPENIRSVTKIIADEKEKILEDLRRSESVSSFREDLSRVSSEWSYEKQRLKEVMEDKSDAVQESDTLVAVEKKNSILVSETRQSSSRHSVTFADEAPEINFLPRIDSEESFFGNEMAYDHTLKDMSLENNITMMSTPIPAASPSTSSSSTDSKPFGTSSSAFKSVNPILPSSLRNDDGIAQPTPDLGPTFEDKLNKITEIVNQTNIRSQNIESKINQIEKNGFTNKSEFTEIQCSNNETVEQNITIQQNISSVNNQIKKETQVMEESKININSQIPGPPKMDTGDNSEENSASSSGYLVKRKSQELCIKRLEDFHKDDIILNQDMQTSESPTKITGFATRDQHGQSGWSFSPEIGPNRFIEGVATRTECDNGDIISGWIPNSSQQKRKQITKCNTEDKNLPLKKKKKK